jgi:hypothetical protein
MLTTIKVTALIAALGFVTVMLDSRDSPSRVIHAHRKRRHCRRRRPTTRRRISRAFPALGGEVASEPPSF